MKVLHVAKAYPPFVGGIEKATYELTRRLALSAEVSVLTCQPRGWGCVQHIEDVSVRRCSSLCTLLSMPISPSFPFHLRRAQRGVDIIHFHHPFPLGELSCLMVRPRPKIVVTWHSDIVRQRWSLKVYKPFLRRFLRRVDRIIVTSAEHLDHSPFLQPVRSKCEIIPLGIDLGRFSLTPDVTSAAEGLRTQYGTPLVLFVGRLSYYKGLPYLIQAMKHVNARCLIIGDGSLRAELIRLAKSCGVTSRITFISGCSDAELPAYYHACDLLVLPSVEPSEAFGLVQLEAMACGKPVVNTDLPTGVRFVNLDGVTGLRVPPRDADELASAINRLISNKHLRVALGMNARQRVEKLFNVNDMVKKYLQLYESLA